MNGGVAVPFACVCFLGGGVACIVKSVRNWANSGIMQPV